MFKIAVIGRGLIGSAAARHLTEMTDGVVVIGPDEPLDRATHNGVFASHYDEGRMARVVDPLVEWSITAKRSISRFGDLEQRSGISFFTPAGFLAVGHPSTPYNDNAAKTGSANGAKLARLTAAQMRTQFPFLHVCDDADGLFETETAGHISPRSLVKAQTALAEKGGATLVKDVAKSIAPVSGGLEIATRGGSTVTAEKAIVSAGAFTKASGLVPESVNLQVYGRTVVLARIEDTMLKNFKGMPTMIHCETGSYILPPIAYPDGWHYLKLGCGSDQDEDLDSSDKLDRWFKGKGSESNRQDFISFMKSMFPPLKDCTDWLTDTCATTYTPNNFPIIDYVDDGRILMAAGGCGKGAKGSDEWGRIAARTVLDLNWEHSFDREKLMLS
ncbi:MAG: FAD-binding oxidoreductase [Hyphomicrobiales bacterium]|nr:FAD-binding oxidoreductase [Hyphomicrobiales bacterium]